MGLKQFNCFHLCLSCSLIHLHLMYGSLLHEVIECLWEKWWNLLDSERFQRSSFLENKMLSKSMTYRLRFLYLCQTLDVSRPFRVNFFFSFSVRFSFMNKMTHKKILRNEIWLLLWMNDGSLFHVLKEKIQLHSKPITSNNNNENKKIVLISTETKLNWNPNFMSLFFERKSGFF